MSLSIKDLEKVEREIWPKLVKLIEADWSRKSPFWEYFIEEVVASE